MRIPSYTRRGAELSEIRLTPMIDVVFLLLLYFVWTAGGQLAERLLASRITPPAVAGGGAANTPSPEIDLERLVVRLQMSQGRMEWLVSGSRAASLDEVRTRLAAVAAITTQLDVVLHPTEEVPLGHVIDVFDLARQLGFPRVQFAANQATP